MAARLAAEFLQNEHRLETSAALVVHNREKKFDSFLNGLPDITPGCNGFGQEDSGRISPQAHSQTQLA